MTIRCISAAIVVVAGCTRIGFVSPPDGAREVSTFDAVVSDSTIADARSDLPSGDAAPMAERDLIEADVVLDTPTTVGWKSIGTGAVTADLTGICGLGSKDLFIVGTGGLALHYDGANLTVINAGTGNDLNGVWCGANDAFAVGNNGTLVRLGASGSGGNQWNHGKESFRGVWGSGASNIFAVGDNGSVSRFDGAAWSALISPTTESLRGVWGASPSDVFAVGFNGTLLRYTGGLWSKMISPSAKHLRTVWGTSSGDVYTVGTNATILRFDGSAWSGMLAPITTSLRGIWGRSKADIFAVGLAGTILRYDGTKWAPMSSGVKVDLLSVSGTSDPSGAVYAVGAGGTVLQLE